MLSQKIFRIKYFVNGEAEKVPSAFNPPHFVRAISESIVEVLKRGQKMFFVFEIKVKLF